MSTQLALLTEVVDAVLSCHQTGPVRTQSVFRVPSSATVIQAIFALHFPAARTVLDMTFGDGTFWKWAHELELTGIDIDPQVEGVYQMDARRTSLLDQSFDVVVMDPPFMHGVKTDGRGSYTGTIPQMDRDYAHLTSQKVIIQLYRDLILEARRLVKPGKQGGVIVKCKDTIEHGDFIEVSRHVSEALQFYDFTLLDKALLVPANNLSTNTEDAVRHFRRQESYFYVARPRARRG